MPHLPPRVKGLLLACHPIPSGAVTAMMIGLFAAAGNPASTIAIGAAAVLTGQLSIGWSNDAWDASRDQISGRPDKPVALGSLSSSLVMRAALVAVAACLPLSMLLGWRAGIVHLIGVSCGWLYNAVAKSTAWSALPFAVAFGGLPAVATLALPDHPWPPAWSMAAGALIGVAAHFANVLPDLDDDRRTGIRGLPHRAGRLGSALAATLSALGAVLIVTFAPGSPSFEDFAALGFAALVALGGLLIFHRRGGGEAVFGATIAIAVIGVVELATSPAFPGTR